MVFRRTFECPPSTWLHEFRADYTLVKAYLEDCIDELRDSNIG